MVAHQVGLRPRLHHGGPCAYAAGEQAHAAGGAMLKLHRVYGDGTMRDRAFVSQLKPLLVKEPLENKLQVLLGRLEKGEEQMPEHVGRSQSSCR